jgi:hypothetical protein
MSRNTNARNLAAVVDLEAARNRPAGERSTITRSDGHRIGNHGNRASSLMKQTVIRQLRDIALIRGDITADDKRNAAASADVSYRQVCRWWRAEMAHQLDEHDYTPADLTADLTDEHLDANDGWSALGVSSGTKPADLPRYLYRHAEPGKFQFTPAEIAFIGQHRCIKDGFAALAKVPGNRIVHLSRSTLYAAWANVSSPVRAGAKYGDKAQRTREATYALTGREQVNESWSIDEYDLKIVADYHGVEVHPKVLIVRERLSGAPLAYMLLPRAANAGDTAVVLTAAAIGFTTPHPRDPERELRVSGLGRMLTTDQGGPFFGEEGAAAARRLGILCNPIESYRPQSNGDHEVMHQFLLRHFVDGPGSRRGWADRAGERLDHGVLPWRAVEEEMAEAWAGILNAAYTKGERKGRTRLEVYADAVDDGNYYDGITLTPADEAAMAVVVAERSYDATRGVYYDDAYWLSPELAAAAEPKERIILKQLLDPAVLYAFDRHDRFIGILLNREEADLEHVHDLHADRAARKQFVEHRIAEAGAGAARDAAAAARARVADRATEPPPVVADGGAADEESSTVVVVDDDRDHVEVVRPTRRGRRPATDDGSGPVDDADVDAITAMFRNAAARRDRDGQQYDHQHDDHEQQQQEQQVEQEVDDREEREEEVGGEDDAR